jgi:cell wall-associated NlpC family hydrolase
MKKLIVGLVFFITSPLILCLVIVAMMGNGAEVKVNANVDIPIIGDNPFIDKPIVSGNYGELPQPDKRRESIIKAGMSLNDKVGYFWGGKFSQLGFCADWGKPRLVQAVGSKNTGNTIPYGLDCSGFVDWCYVQAGFGNVLSGGGTYYQFDKSYEVTEPQLGDLVFNRDCSHIGIFAGYRNGQAMCINSLGDKGVTYREVSRSGLTNIYHRVSGIEFK